MPIEEIIELRLEIAIVPITGLFQSFEVDAFITSDVTTINVDEFIYMNRLNRLRFSLAHEMGHAVLHPNVFRQLGPYNTLDEWKALQASVDDSAYRRLEWQASTFAAFVLMPEDDIQKRFPIRKREVQDKAKGMNDVRSGELQNIVVGLMAKEFGVSEEAMRIRLENAEIS